MTSSLSPTAVDADVLVLAARTGQDDTPVLLTEGLSLSGDGPARTALDALHRDGTYAKIVESYLKP